MAKFNAMVNASLNRFIEFFGNFLRSIGKRVLFIFPLFSISVLSQVYNGALDTSLAEKIYLQHSSSVYATDQTIWFKAIVTDSENQVPSEASGVLYVDLIDSNEQIVEHLLVKLSHGKGNGSFELQDGKGPGRYLIRAYTQWNLNFGEDFIFKSYINLYNSTKDKNTYPIEALSVIEKGQGQFFLTGELWPQGMGDETEKEIQVYLDWGKGQDTIALKRKGRGGFKLGYDIPKESDYIDLTLDNGRNLQHTETIILNDSLPDVQFFPESGQLVHGFPNKVGFKALGFDGKGRKIRGEVFDNLGNRVKEFKSNHLGMGVFSMEAESGATYHVKISSMTDSASTSTYSLPKVVSKGTLLSVDKAEDKIKIKVATSDLIGDVSIKASCRGADHYLIEGPLREGYMVSDLPSADLPEGIIVFTLMDSKKMPVAERLYFNESEKDRLNILLETDKTVYERREETKLDIQVGGSNAIPPNIDLSVMVISEKQWHHGKSGNILSYFLLESELRGEVEAPGYYFEEGNPNRSNDLNALLSTQGWRNYKYPIKRQGRSFFWPQPGLTVKGSIRHTGGRKKSVEDIDMTITTFGKETSYYTQKVNNMGRFYFLLDDSYGKRMRILLSTTNTEGKREKYSLLLDSLRTPDVVYESRPSIRKLDPIVSAVVAAKERRDETKMVFDSLYGVTQLEEVVVEDYRLKPERKVAYKEYGEPDVVITGEDIRKKEEKWSYGLYSILLFNYADQVEIERFSDGFVLAHIKAGGEPTLLMVDGKLLTEGEYDLVPNMSPGIVEDIELIKYAKSFRKQFLKVFPDTHPLDAPSLGHIISIYTKGGVGIQGTGRPLAGTLETTIDVFSPIKEFYGPKYDRPVPADNQEPDLRSLIHWVPSIHANKNANAEATFYNGDIMDNYVIIVEGISKDGRIGYREIEYRVGDEHP